MNEISNNNANHHKESANMRALRHFVCDKTNGNCVINGAIFLNKRGLKIAEYGMVPLYSSSLLNVLRHFDELNPMNEKQPFITLETTLKTITICRSDDLTLIFFSNSPTIQAQKLLPSLR